MNRSLGHKSMVALIACLAATSSIAMAADYPTKPITIVVPYSAGGASDAQIRLIAQPLSKILGQPIVVENRAGASGAIAAAHVARSAPDGYTLLYPNNGLLIAPLQNKSATFDPLKDFTPITTVTTMPMTLVVNKDLPVENISDLISYAKERPNKINYASAGPGSYGSLATRMLSQAAGLKMFEVSYKGEANTTMSVRANETQVLFTAPSATMFGQIDAGNLKLLGVASAKHSEIAPDAQPIAEVLPGFSAEIWFGLLAPANTPAPIVDEINQAVRQTLKDPDIRKALLANAAIAQPSTPQEFKKLLYTEHAQFAKIISERDLVTN